MVAGGFRLADCSCGLIGIRMDPRGAVRQCRARFKGEIAAMSAGTIGLITGGRPGDRCPEMRGEAGGLPTVRQAWSKRRVPLAFAVSRDLSGAAAIANAGGPGLPETAGLNGEAAGWSCQARARVAGCLEPVM